jgi:hypothetical protein
LPVHSHHSLLCRWRWTAIVCVCVVAVKQIGYHAEAASSAVAWTELVNATVTQDTLQKTSGCDGCFDAGATSAQQITAGDGYVEFTVAATNTLFIAGLSHDTSGTGYAEIDFAFRFNGAGQADVLENGIYVGGDTSYGVGDLFRIAVVGGTVRFSRNGSVVLQRSTNVAYPLLMDVALANLGAALRGAIITSTAPNASGGFIEKAGDQTYRARFTPTQITSFLPAGGATGPFKFPAPYNTEGVRLTGAMDCDSGQDCLWPVGYSYWRNINNHAGSDIMYIVLGFDRTRGGDGPSLIAYSKVTDQVQNLGPLFSTDSPYSYSTTEGWYFSATAASRLYAFLPGGTTLRRYDLLARQFEAVPAFDLAACPRPSICPSDAAFIFQPHSSDDDRMHSATVQDASFRRLGCVASDSSRFVYVPTRTGYLLDECHLDKSGRWLLMLETQAGGALDNRVVDLATGTVTAVTDAAGALGHLDTGFGYAIGADNYNSLPNASILVKFPLASTQRPIGPVVHFNKRWDIAAANHIAHGNAIAGRPPEDQYACGSNASRVADMADEIVCFSLNPTRNADRSLDVLIVGQIMTDLDAPGGSDLDGDDYEQVPKGNLDVTGRYFIWTANLGGNRLDAFIVKVPAELLAPITTPPAPEPSPAPLNVAAIQPNVVAQRAGTVTFIVNGTGFAPGVTLAFEGGDGPAPRVSRVIRESSTQLSVTAQIRSGGPARDRLWDVRVTNPDGSTAVATGLLRITP